MRHGSGILRSAISLPGRQGPFGRDQRTAEVLHGTGIFLHAIPRIDGAIELPPRAWAAEYLKYWAREDPRAMLNDLDQNFYRQILEWRRPERNAL
jgi:hypothetical protein